MYFLTKYTERILDCYRTHLELIDSTPIGFTGVASERPAPVYTDEVAADTLWFAAGVTFTVFDVLIRVNSISPQYNWMANNRAVPQDTPIGAFAGLSTQVMPVLPLIQPFFLKAQGRLQMYFTNSATAAVTGGIITWRALKLLDPIQQSDGTFGWDYAMASK